MPTKLRSTTKKKGSTSDYDPVPSNNQHHDDDDYDDLDNVEEQINISDNSNINNNEYFDDEYESDPLVDDGDENENDDDDDMQRKKKMMKKKRITTPARKYRERTDNSDAIMCSWVGMIIFLSLIVLSSFIYWNYTRHHHHMEDDAALMSDSLMNGNNNIRTRPPRVHHNHDDDDDDDDDNISNDNKEGTFYFDPFAAIHTSNPLDLTDTSVDEYYAQTLVPPVQLWNDDDDNSGSMQDNEENHSNQPLGYMMQPDVVNGHVVFVSEGDMYLSVVKDIDGSETTTTTTTPDPTTTTTTTAFSSSAIPAMKLTTTVGNVRDPKINPKYPYLIAYTATYTARRDVYLLDLRRKKHGNQPALRLTYWPISAGVGGIVGWKGGDGKTLVFKAMSNEISMQDYRMYEITLGFDDDIDNESDVNNSTKATSTTATTQQTIQHPQVMQTNPVPLAQALEGVFHDHEDCWYFTRMQQSSSTARYQGGTAEAIWSWCVGHELAVDLTTYQFNGTSKAPSIFSFHQNKEKFHYLLFSSDRGPNNDPNDPNEWKATTMNLWAMPLPEKEELMELAYPTRARTTAETLVPPKIPSFNPSHFVKLTNVACDFNGMSLREYSLDPVTQNVVLRIGADLHWLSAEVIQQKLLAAMPASRHLKDSSSNNTDMRSTRQEFYNPTSNNASQVKEKGAEIQKLDILVYSDFHEHQERFVPVDVPDDLDTADVYETAFGTPAYLMTLRGQVWVAPVVENFESITTAFTGAGRNLPPRRYRIAPGSKMGGAVRVLACRHVPVLMEDHTFSRRLAVILATDPRSPTAEHAFYLIETQSDASPSFLSFDDLPIPFLGGWKGGGSVRDGGLGSVMPSSMRVSPCGRRLAWTDTDGRICVMTLPLYKEKESEYNDYIVLPKENELGEPLIGEDADLNWSPGGRYLAVEHNARNQFTIISMVDCGDPLMVGSRRINENESLNSKANGLKIGRIAQATPARFNSFSTYFGRSTFDQDFYSDSANLAETYHDEEETKFATTTLYFLTDRDIVNKKTSPWGNRAPNPSFDQTSVVYALPLLPQEHRNYPMSGHFSGGGAMELYAERILDLKSLEKKDDRGLTTSPSQAPSVSDPKEHFPQDPDIVFGLPDLSFARKAYRLANIPESAYVKIVSQATDDGSMLLVKKKEKKYYLSIASVGDFPSDEVEMKEISLAVDDFGLSSSRDYIFVTIASRVIVVSNSATGLADLLGIESSASDPTSNVAFTQGMTISVWPSLEYQQMYGDAWRMMRDYYYDPLMAGIDWQKMFERYRGLVRRCAKREELDDVLEQMASEVSALHVFVYGGGYNSPLEYDETKENHVPASFGVAVQRSAEWKGYMITSLPQLDPDFGLIDSQAVFSPLSDQTLRMSGQKGLNVGDVIVSINNEGTVNVPDIHMLLRGLAYESVRLGVLRLSAQNQTESIKLEPVIAVPIDEPEHLLYSAWEWKTRQMANNLAEKAGFTVGYVHLRSMSAVQDGDAFYRDYFSDYDKEALVVDVRHNRGGNIDWWLLDVLQRKAWMYWQGRSTNATTGGLGWDEQYSFRGHIVVLIDEKTSSDGEGFSRGMSELGLGKLIGKRTWGGGIWLASDNRLVDGGIASAPEIGTYNEHFGFGLGIEQMGVEPDIIVDNNPRTSYDGKDTQLEHAIDVLKDWLIREPVIVPTAPSKKRNMAFDETESCAASP